QGRPSQWGKRRGRPGDSRRREGLGITADLNSPYSWHWMHPRLGDRCRSRPGSGCRERRRPRPPLRSPSDRLRTWFRPRTRPTRSRTPAAFGFLGWLKPMGLLTDSAAARWSRSRGLLERVIVADKAVEPGDSVV